MSENRDHINNDDCRVWDPSCEDDHLRRELTDFARRRLPEGAKHYAEDFVPEAFIRFYKYADASEVEDKRNYLFKTVKNLCYDFSHSRSRMTSTNSLPLDAPRHEEEDMAIVELRDPGRGPEMDAIIHEENACLLAEIDAQTQDFTERERKMVYWHICGWTNEEIARQLNEDITLVRVDMNRIMAKLRYRLATRR